MKTITIIIIIFLIFSFYMLYRNNKVFNLRGDIIDKSYEWGIIHINYTPAIYWALDNIPSYNTMLYNFWIPMKLENFMDKKYIDVLNSDVDITKVDLVDYPSIKKIS